MTFLRTRNCSATTAMMRSRQQKRRADERAVLGNPATHRIATHRHHRRVVREGVGRTLGGGARKPIVWRSLSALRFREGGYLGEGA